MAKGSERGGGEAEAGDRLRRHAFEAPRQYRIERPDDGSRQGEAVAQQRAPFERKAGRALPPGDENDEPEKADERAENMAPFEPLAWQSRREQHDQKRPEVVEEAGFGRRCETQRREIE